MLCFFVSSNVWISIMKPYVSIVVDIWLRKERQQRETNEQRQIATFQIHLIRIRWPFVQETQFLLIFNKQWTFLFELKLIVFNGTDAGRQLEIFATFAEPNPKSEFYRQIRFVISHRHWIDFLEPKSRQSQLNTGQYERRLFINTPNNRFDTPFMKTKAAFAPCKMCRSQE